MKKPWDRTRLSIKWWHGKPPESGDGLVTRTGRKYLIIDATPTRLDCIVLPKDEPIHGTTFVWEWAPRRRER